MRRWTTDSAKMISIAPICSADPGILNDTGGARALPDRHFQQRLRRFPEIPPLLGKNDPPGGFVRSARCAGSNRKRLSNRDGCYRRMSSNQFASAQRKVDSAIRDLFALDYEFETGTMFGAPQPLTIERP
jgi:hypothetical protein